MATDTEIAAFLNAKIAEADGAARTRESMAQAEEYELTPEDIASAVKVTRARGPKRTAEDRKRDAATQRRIAETHRREAAMYRALAAREAALVALQAERDTDAWHQGWRVAVRERDEARRECEQWREKWNATLDREARRNAEILQLQAANKEMREVLLTLSTADPKHLAENPVMTAGMARMALKLADHHIRKESADAS